MPDLGAQHRVELKAGLLGSPKEPEAGRQCDVFSAPPEGGDGRDGQPVSG